MNLLKINYFNYNSKYIHDDSAIIFIYHPIRLFFANTLQMQSLFVLEVEWCYVLTTLTYVGHAHSEQTHYDNLLLKNPRGLVLWIEQGAILQPA